MIFSKKKIIIAYTIEKCPECNMQRKRKFVKDDILFTKSSKCTSCNGIAVIEKIFGESFEQ